MNCYLCLVETGCDYQPAYALCQRCGAGICGEHLKELRFLPAAGLIDAHPTPKYSLICQRCYQVATSSSTRPVHPPAEKSQKRQIPLLSAFWRKRLRQVEEPSPLPTEADAVILAERFLKQQRNR